MIEYPPLGADGRESGRSILRKEKMTAKQQKEIDRFNAACPVGTTVTVKLDDGSEVLDEVKYPASALGGHTPVAWLKTRGIYLLSRVRRTLARETVAP